MRVVCAGHVNWDVTFRLDRLPDPDDEAHIRSQRQGGGGSAANVAAALCGLDVGAGLVGSVADDEHGLLVRRGLSDAGVDLDGLRVVDGQTAVKYLLVDDDGEVAVLGTEGANEAVGPDDVDPAYVTAGEHVHLTSQRPETAVRIAEVATDAGLGVSFAPGRRVADRDYGPVLERADVLFLNEREAAAVRRPDDDRTLVVTHGSDGATLESPDGDASDGGYDADAVDTTGAGDAFAAGFLAAWLERRDAAEALSVGNACGALAAAAEGPRVDLSWEAVERVRSGGSG